MSLTLRDQPCFDALAADIRSFAEGRPLVTILNTGNWGDALVHYGLKHFLSDAGIAAKYLYMSRVKKIRRIWIWRQILTNFGRREALVMGAGAFRDHYPRQEEIAAAARDFSRVVVLPSSFGIVPAFDLSRTTLWRRDSGESAQTVPEARFCHDMAFYLKPQPRNPIRKVGLLFRTDVERAEFDLPPGNIDISNEGTHRSDPERFLDRVGEYEIIATNRLHVGIAGALLGREVHLFGGSNDKVRSIFECSLKPFFENVHFHSTAPDSDFFQRLGGK